MPETRRILGYARVSTAEQALGSSLADQQASLAAYAKTRGLTVAQFFVESESGGREKLERREEIRELLRDARRGDLVLVDKLDRWSRDPEFTYRSVRELLERGASMFFVAEGIDPATRDGDTHLNFRILFAREEHKRIRERTTGTREKLRQRGYFVEGHVPFGYRRSKPKSTRDVERHVLVVEPGEAEIVRKVFQRAARGERLADIAADIGWIHQRVLRTIHNRHYLGEIRREKKGEWTKGLHPAIVTPSLFARANSTVTGRLLGPRRSAENSRTKNWLIKNVAHCAYCGAAMVSVYSRSSGSNRDREYAYFYYRCFARCRPRNYVLVPAAEALAAALVATRLVSLRNELAKGPEPVRGSVDYAAKRAVLDRRRAKHIEAHGSDIISLAELRTQLAKLDEERQKIDAAESAAGAGQRTRDPAVRREMLCDVKLLEERWRDSLPATRRDIVNQLAKEMRIRKGKGRLPEVEPVWRSLEELVEDLGR